MADEVDALIVAMTKKVKRVYGEAYREAAVQLGAFLQQFAKDDENMKQKVKDGAITEKEYKEWRDDTIVQARQYDSMLNTLAEDLVKADKKASSIINGYLPSAYALGVNSALFEVCKKTGYDIDPTFTLYDRHTVELLLKDDEALFPKSNINIRKDNKVTRQRLQNSVTKGILKGDSIDKIAKDMQQVTGMSYNSAVRAARTLTGSAQNLGRLESYKHAEEMGVKLDKIWVATPDMKTRDSHRHLDMERVPVDKPFSNGCMCPKDPNGSPEEVINCRCTMISAPMGFEYNTTNRYTKLPPGITYDEWKEDREETKKNYRTNLFKPTKGRTQWIDGKEVIPSYTVPYSARKHKISIRNDYNEDVASIRYTVDENGAFTIDYIHTRFDSRNEGYATKLLNQILNTADATDSTVDLFAYPEADVDYKRLVNWYMKMGFRPTEFGYDLDRERGLTMIYYPSSI